MKTFRKTIDVMLLLCSHDLSSDFIRHLNCYEYRCTRAPVLWQFFIFPLYSPQYKSITIIAGYGVMGSKPPARRHAEPANRKRFARRIPSIGCVPTHPHLLTIFPSGKMTANELARGYAP